MSHEKDAWTQLMGAGELPDSHGFSPGKAQDGYYSQLLKDLRLRQAAADDLAVQRLDPSRPKTTEDKLAELQRQADDLQDKPFTRRLMTLRQASRDLGLLLPDRELQGLLNAARCRLDGLTPLVGRRPLDLTPVPWLVKGLLMARALNLLVAGPKVGKTSLVLGLIGRWSRGGREFLGMELTGPCPPVLLMGPDMPEPMWGAMLQAEGLLDANNCPAEVIVGLSTSGCGWQLDEEGIALVADLARRHPGLLVVIDSLKHATRLMGIDENTAAADAPLRALDAALDGTGATALVIHHAGKAPTTSPTLASRGSSAIPAAASQIIGLQRVAAEEGSKDRRIILRTEGRGGLPVEVLIERSPDWGWVSHGDAEQVAAERRLQAAEAKLTGRQADLLDAVRTRAAEGLTTAAEDVHDLIDGRDSLRAARSTLDQLTAKGLVVAAMENTGIGRRKTYRPRMRLSSGGDRGAEGGKEGGDPSRATPEPSYPSDPSSPSETQAVSIAENPYRERDRRVGRDRRVVGRLKEDRRVPSGGKEGVSSAVSEARTMAIDFGALDQPPTGSGADAHLDADDPAWGPPPAA